ncbi:MAG: YqgE/AlgH family protein [Gammaproteobacteria bacterium]|nr:YqgE/AlgH family protein [Gammaproteobacteria bacterium]
MQSLQNHFLIAMPSLNDSYFHRAVIYICEHDENGAMGLAVNQPISQLTVKQLLEKIEVASDCVNPDNLNNHVFNGGPVSPDRGFVLHSPQIPWTSSVQLSQELMVTTSKDILAVMGSDAAPEKYLLALGYSGWSAGQLEQEIVENSWLTISADPNIIFNIKPEERWEHATKQLGFAPWQLNSQIGHG